MKHNSVSLKVWGDFACFTRPEMKVERVSYDVITPSAARGILEAIYWKPQIRWIVERIHVLKPVNFTSVRRNELATNAKSGGVKIPKGKVEKAVRGQQVNLGIGIDEYNTQGKLKYRQQRAAMILRDVAYAIESHFKLLDTTDTIEKHYNMFKRRAEKGQCFHHPYLGCREFPADFAWIDGQPPPTELPPDQSNRDLGFMLLDIEYVPDAKGPIIESSAGRRIRAEPRFFRAVMKGGAIAVPAIDSKEVRT